MGFIGQDAAISLVKSQGIVLGPDTETVLSEQIAKAVDYVGSLSGRRNLTPEIREIPSGLFNDRQQKLVAEPTFQEHLTGMDHHSFALVEVAKLHAFQPNLNLEYVENLKKTAPSLSDVGGLLRFCLPTQDEVAESAALGGFNPVTNTWTLTSENLDLRIVGSFTGKDANNRPFFAFAYGRGLPQLSVVEYKGLYMIKNGYHRAYALMEKGHKFIPCILVKTDNYGLTGAIGQGFFNIDLMTSDKSPLLGDFSSPAGVIYSRRLVRVIVSVHAEVQVIPV